MVRLSCSRTLLQRDPSSRTSEIAMFVENSNVASIYSPMEALMLVEEACVSSNVSASVSKGFWVDGWVLASMLSRC